MNFLQNMVKYKKIQMKGENYGKYQCTSRWRWKTNENFKREKTYFYNCDSNFCNYDYAASKHTSGWKSKVELD